ncbi:MAG: hypothetical protein HYR66_11420 [Sphingobacteriales bacterium]|nr:hypothetical protein [Sphingobacteriales bacterium]MBI3719021.1 hypothetical protein [Sphingobacteriales bacterium]
MIELKYYNEKLKIGMKDWKIVYQFPNEQLMIPEVHQGQLYYRSRGSDKRISYKKIKRGLTRQVKIIEEYVPF